MEKLEFLESLSKISGLLDVIDDALEQILEAQFGYTDKDWLEAVQKLEAGYSAIKRYVMDKVEAVEKGR